MPHVICHLVHIKSSSAAFQHWCWTVILNSLFKRKFILHQKCWIPCHVSFMHWANLKRIIIDLTLVMCFSCEGHVSCRSLLCSACTRLAERRAAVTHGSTSTSTSVSLQSHVNAVQGLGIKTSRDFLQDGTVETHSHVLLWLATALFWKGQATASWTVVLLLSGWENICRNVFILFVLMA